MSDKDEGDGLAEAARRKAEQRRKWLRDGEPSVARRLAQIGVLGWIVVVPTLAGIFIGRYADKQLNTGIFWTAPLLMLGLILGCWSAWRWMRASEHDDD